MNREYVFLSVLVVLFYFIFNCDAVDDKVLFSVTRAPRFFGILQDHRGQPQSVEVSEEYMDQDYIATNRKRHRIDWNKNPLDIEDFDEEQDTEEVLDEKDKDVKVPSKNTLLVGPV